MPPKSIVQQDFSKGTNLPANPYCPGQQQSQRLLNLLLDEHCSLRNRPGATTLTTAPAAGRRIVRVFDFVRLDGTIIKLAILRGSSIGAPGPYGTTPYGTGAFGGGSELFNRGTLPWTLIGTFLTQENVPDMLGFTDKTLIAHGYETPWSYDGVTFTQITASGGGSQSLPPGAK